jgi:DNA modification methylase
MCAKNHEAMNDLTVVGIVLDAFGGSGSTLIAAERTGRRARLIEIDPVYCDRTIRRWQALAKDEAILAATGETF